MTDEEKEREALLVDLRADFGEHLFFTDKARALLRAHDARVWEEAAKFLDELAKRRDATAYGDGVHGDLGAAYQADTIRECAAALRALAPKGEKP